MFANRERGLRREVDETIENYLMDWIAPRIFRQDSPRGLADGLIRSFLAKRSQEAAFSLNNGAAIREVGHGFEFRNSKAFVAAVSDRRT